MTENNDIKIVVTGKGGAGKTTLVSTMSFLLSDRGFNVLALDEDPQMNLPHALGLSKETINHIVPLNENYDYIEEKTGARPGTNWGAYFRLNPPVADVVDRFGITVKNNLHLLVMGTVKKAAAGCLCPENALLDAVVKHVSLREHELVIMDTQAGVEHFGRALSEGFKHCIVVTDDTFNAMSVACQSAKLAKEIGIEKIHLVFNRTVKGSEKSGRIDGILEVPKEKLFDSITYLPFEDLVAKYEPDMSKLAASEGSLFVEEVKKLMELLIS
jgi:CO dehydrogenase maturation factor